MKKLVKGTKIKNDCYIISENERNELRKYRKMIKQVKENYTNYVKTYKY